VILPDVNGYPQGVIGVFAGISAGFWGFLTAGKGEGQGVRTLTLHPFVLSVSGLPAMDPDGYKLQPVQRNFN